MYTGRLITFDRKIIRSVLMVGYARNGTPAFRAEDEVCGEIRIQSPARYDFFLRCVFSGIRLGPSNLVFSLSSTHVRLVRCIFYLSSFLGSSSYILSASFVITPTPRSPLAKPYRLGRQGGFKVVWARNPPWI